MSKKKVISKNKDELDVNCDPDNPRIIEYEAILAAHKRIMGSVVRTPCKKTLLSEKLGMEVYLKMELLQYTGSFKERGVRNSLLLLDENQRKQGVIAASFGNHGSAICYHAKKMGIPCTVVMPVKAPMAKVKKCEKFGGEVIIHGVNLPEAKKFAMSQATKKNMLYLNGYDHPNIIEGQGTVGIEIIEQVPDVDAILVPCGGGSLLAGVAVAVKRLRPETEIYGVETDKTCSMTESLKKSERTLLPIKSTIAEGLGVGLVGVNTFHTIKSEDLVKKMVTVNEDWVARAIMRFVEQERCIVEGAGAVTLASVMAGLYPTLAGKKVVCVCSGGNIDTTTLTRALEHGMAEEGRLIKFKVVVNDRPTGMANLCSLLCRLGVTVRECVAERAWIEGDVYSCELKTIVETKGWPHAKEMIIAVKKHYKDCCYFPPIYDELFQIPVVRRSPCLAPNPLCMKKSS